MKTPIVFKKEFEDKLNELGVKERFVRALMLNEEERLSDKIEMLNARKSWRDFLMHAFLWVYETENADWDNHSFWMDLADNK